jgi:hypothetical protein
VSYYLIRTSYYCSAPPHPAEIRSAPNRTCPLPTRGAKLSMAVVTGGHCVRMRHRHERRWVPRILRSQVVDAPDCVRRRPELTDGEIIHIRGRPANIAAAAMYIAVVRPNVSPKAP